MRFKLHIRRRLKLWNIKKMKVKGYLNEENLQSKF